MNRIVILGRWWNARITATSCASTAGLGIDRISCSCATNAIKDSHEMREVHRGFSQKKIFDFFGIQKDDFKDKGSSSQDFPLFGLLLDCNLDIYAWNKVKSHGIGFRLWMDCWSICPNNMFTCLSEAY